MFLVEIQKTSNLKILFCEEIIVVASTWKDLVLNLKVEPVQIDKRLQVLDELLTNNEISKRIYEEIKREYKSLTFKIEEQQKSLLNTLTKKSQELDQNLLTLKKIFLNLKIQHKLGKIKNEVYNIIDRQISLGIEKTLQEKKDLEEALNLLNLKKKK